MIKLEVFYDEGEWVQHTNPAKEGKEREKRGISIIEKNNGVSLFQNINRRRCFMNILVLYKE